MKTQPVGFGRKLLFTSLVSALAGCGVGPVADAGTDPVVDSGFDAGMTAADAGFDAGLDAGVDAGLDAGDGLIGPEGGTVVGPFGARLVVPKDALSTRVPLAVTVATDAPALDAGLRAVSKVYAFTPHGTHFAIPATVTIPFDPAALPNGNVPKLYQAEADAGFYALAGAQLNDAGTMVTNVADLSFFLVGDSVLQLNALSKNCGRQALGGKLYCWGDLTSVRGDHVPMTPSLMFNGRAFGQFSFGGSVLCGISGIETWCMGDNSTGALGDGTTITSYDGVKVATPGDLVFSQVSVGADFACGLGGSSGALGEIWCWGDNLRGQLGTGQSGADKGSLIPAPIGSVYKYVNVAAGYQDACGVRTTGEVDCWGDDGFGQMGKGHNNTVNQLQATPLEVPGVKLAISTGSLTEVGTTICGLQPDGGATCWGQNGNGQTGDGTVGTGGIGPNDFKKPTPVSGGLIFSNVFGGYQSCGLDPSGDAYCWGFIDLANRKQSTPLHVLGPMQFSALTHGCGISVDQRTYCWGDNSAGQLGQGSNMPAESATPIPLPFQ